VHYFGFKNQNIEEIVSLCKSKGIIVVEDCAHLYNYNNYDLSVAGTFGDFVFYSLHKFLPIKTGGILVQNNPSLVKPKKLSVDLKINYSFEIASYDLRSIVAKRIANFNLMDSLINNINGVYCLKQLNTGDIPHNYPIIVENGLREKLYFWLIDHGITLMALYYRLIDSIKIETYKSAHLISNSILNLPIHQDIGVSEIKHIVKLIDKGIKELS
jgi:dTDP-4-amino-4,6-dideoxygalactose transaminase